MNCSLNRGAAVALVGSFLLVGCGGSGTELPATGEANIPTGETVTALTLSGLVTDDPIVNADVMISVGNTEFSSSVPTGSLGEFQVRIDSQNPSALVKGTAYDAANGVRLTATLDTFEGCVELARNDVVNSVKITNITTAKQVLTERLALDGNVESFDEFVSLSSQVDATELLELASAIKIVVENLGGNTLPSGYADTLALARSIAAGTSTFESDVELLSPGILAQAQAKLLTDGHATLLFSADDAQGVYVSSENRYIYAMFGTGTALVDYFADQAFSTIPSWSITESGAIELRYFDVNDSRDTLTLLSSTDRSLQIVTDNSLGNQPRIASTVTKYGFGGAFAQAAVVGQFADPRNVNDRLTLQTDGVGFSTSGDQQTAFTWSIDEAGHLNIAWPNTGRTLELINLDDGASVLSITRFDGQFPQLTVGTWSSS
ncbi:MAG: hypothetical protein AAF465_04960 [Pseudomonadota bacterium]